MPHVMGARRWICVVMERRGVEHWEHQPHRTEPYGLCKMCNGYTSSWSPWPKLSKPLFPGRQYVISKLRLWKYTKLIWMQTIEYWIDVGIMGQGALAVHSRLVCLGKTNSPAPETHTWITRFLLHHCLWCVSWKKDTRPWLVVANCRLQWLLACRLNHHRRCYCGCDRSTCRR